MSGPAKTEGQTTEGCRGKGESSSRCPGYCRFAQCRSNPNASVVVSDVKRFFEKGGNEHLQVYSAMCNYQATSETTTIINNIWIYVGQKTQSRKQRMQTRFILPHLASNWTQHAVLRTKTLSKRRMPGAKNGLSEGGPNEFWSQLSWLRWSRAQSVKRRSDWKLRHSYRKFMELSSISL